MIQDWTNPSAIYLLILVMIGMLVYVRRNMWRKMRVLSVYKTFSKEDAQIDLKPFHLRCILAELVALAISTLFLIFLPKTTLFGVFCFEVFCDICLSVGVYYYEKSVFKRYVTVPETIERNLDMLSRDPLIRNFTVRPFLFGFSLILMIIAMMGPQGNARTTHLNRIPMHVTILFDLSRSMDAEDVYPSRLDAAKDEIVSLLRRSRGDEFGLVYFTDTTFIQSPHTHDLHTIKTLLMQSKTTDMPTTGTDIPKALHVALGTFEELHDLRLRDELSGLHRLVIVTDGETHSTEVESILEIYQANHIPIDVMAFGTVEGAQILDKSGYALRYHAEPVLSRLDRDGLQHMSKVTGGFYQEYVQPEIMAERLSAEWDSIRIQVHPESGLGASVYRVQLYDRFLYISFGMMTLFMMYPLLTWILSPYRRRRSEQKAHDYRNEISTLDSSS